MAKIPAQVVGHGLNVDWKFKLVSWHEYSIGRGKYVYYWNMQSRNGEVFFTGGEDLTKNNRDKAVEKVANNWRGPLRIVYHEGPTFIPATLKLDYIKRGEHDVS